MPVTKTIFGKWLTLLLTVLLFSSVAVVPVAADVCSVLNITQGAPGANGTNGINGTAATITVGTTTTGAPGSSASVTNIGTTTAAIFDFSIPRGFDGATGPAGTPGINGTNGINTTMVVNYTFTGLPNINATVTNVGNATAAKLDFTIPQGLTGDTGAAGATGGAGGQILYFRHADSTDPITYEGLIPVPAGATEVDEVKTIKNTNGKTLVDSYITDIGYPAVTEYPAGLWRFRTFGYVDSASGTTTFIFDVYNRTSSGTETLLFTTTSEDVNALVPTEYLTSHVQTVAYPVALTDRIVVKVSVQTTHSANVAVHWVYEGSTHTSHIQTALSSAPDSTLSFNVIAGETLYKGQAVYISGATGGNPVVMRADNLATVSSRVVGLMDANTASGARGIVRRAGALTNVDTRSTNTNINPLGQNWTAGDLLFSTSTGGLTNIRPTSGRSVKAAYTLSGSSDADTLLAYPMENPVWTTAAAGENIVLRMGDSGGINKVSFRNYTNSEVGWVLSNGTSSFTGSNYNASYLTSTYNATYDAKNNYNASYITSTYNATYDAKTNYNSSYWTGTNYNASYWTGTNYNATYDGQSNYNSSYLTSTYNATYDAKPSSTFNATYDAYTNYNASYLTSTYNATYDAKPDSTYNSTYDSFSNYNASYITSTYNATYDAKTNYNASYWTGTNYNSSYLTSSYNVTYDAKTNYNASYLTSTYNATYDAKADTNYNASYWTGTNYNSSYWTGTNYNATYDGQSNYNASYLTSTFNATYDSKPSSTYNATYDAKTNYNASYWTGSNYNSSYLTSSYNTTYDAKTNYNGSYVELSNSSYFLTDGSRSMLGNISFIGQFYINGLTDPSQAQDAATKNYVDTRPANNYNASYLTSTYNATYDAKTNYNASYITSTYNATYDAKNNYNASYWTGTNYNASYWTGTNYNSSYLTSTYNTTYDAKTNYNASYVTLTNGSYILGTNLSYYLVDGTRAMTGNLSMGSKYINNLISGGLGSDAVNKSYVDSIAGNYNATYDAKPSIATIYPVGSIYISTVSTNPNTLFGVGTWAAFGTGRVLVGINASDTNFDVVEEVGGTKTVASAGTVASIAASGDTAVKAGTSASTAAPISHTHAAPAYTGTATSIVQPYIVVYMWERTA